MVQLHETEVDGVRCFWVETGRPTLAAVMVFRFGQADEPIVESGWQHLLEHLALHSRGGGSLHVNGQVGLLETIFDAHGPPGAVADHYGRVTRWLSEPRFEELVRERGVLQAEAEFRGSGPSTRALGWRYGARGPGVASYNEPGLGRASPEGLAARAARVFTTGNAVLVLDGPPPADLRLALPEGDVIAPSTAVPCEDNLPAAYVEETGVMLSSVVPRSAAMNLAFDLLRHGLTDRLRHEDGTAYAPWSSYERVDWDHAVLLGGSDLNAAGLPTVAATGLRLFERLAQDGPTEDELRELKDSRVQALLDPYATFGVGMRAAHEYLQGLPTVTLDEMVSEVTGVTTQQVAESFRAARSTLMVGLPSEATLPPRLRALKFRTTYPKAKGVTVRSINWPASDGRVVVADDRLEVSSGGVAREVKLAEAEGMLVFPDGLRHLMRRDGYGLTVDPAQWSRGSHAVTRLDAVVPAHLHLPQPARDMVPVPRLRVFQRWAPVIRFWLSRAVFSMPFLFLLSLIAFGVIGYLMLRLDVDGLGVPFLFFAALWFRALFGREGPENADGSNRSLI